ncbi:ATP-binding cassette domain-containing protein [Paenibacillus hodogayensis]|uniref:ATP-binding cassette domain-containing protein n=1 Tax=Paenibacillus hodogayensis TaxID=279208 RepID=A0ABV5VSV7_9BACL
MNAIRCKDLHKSYGKTVALDYLNLSVERGEVYGFIGPNGAGKSTTIRILLGLLHKESGEVELLGGDPWRDASTLHKRLAYVPGDVSLWGNLTGGEVIDMLGNMRGGFEVKRKNELLARFELDPRKKCNTYSKGNRQKVALVAAFVSDVDLYILDEPTSGLDPLMELVFQDCVTEMKKQGKTVFLSSHILAEVEALCDKVGIIRKGKLIETGTLDELRHLTRTTVIVETIKPVTDLGEFIFDKSTEGGKLRFSVDTSNWDEVLKRLTCFGVKSLVCKPPTLEELFMRHYGETIT